MGFFDKLKEKKLENAKDAIEAILLDNEQIENYFDLVIDYGFITDKRLVFIDKDGADKAVISIPFNKINYVSVVTKPLSFTKIIVLVGSTPLSFIISDLAKANEVYKNIMSKLI